MSQDIDKPFTDEQLAQIRQLIRQEVTRAFGLVANEIPFVLDPVHDEVQTFVMLDRETAATAAPYA